MSCCDDVSLNLTNNWINKLRLICSKLVTAYMTSLFQDEDKEEMKEILEMKRRHERHVQKRKNQTAGINSNASQTQPQLK